MKKLTIPQMLDLVPMGGGVTIRAPFEEIAKYANKRNSELKGEWFDVALCVDAKGGTIVLIERREVWNIVSAEHLMETQRFWRNTVQEWRA